MLGIVIKLRGPLRNRRCRILQIIDVPPPFLGVVTTSLMKTRGLASVEGQPFPNARPYHTAKPLCLMSQVAISPKNVGATRLTRICFTVALLLGSR